MDRTELVGKLASIRNTDVAVDINGHLFNVIDCGYEPGQDKIVLKLEGRIGLYTLRVELSPEEEARDRQLDDELSKAQRREPTVAERNAERRRNGLAPLPACNMHEPPPYRGALEWSDDLVTPHHD